MSWMLGWMLKCRQPTTIWIWINRRWTSKTNWEQQQQQHAKRRGGVVVAAKFFFSCSKWSGRWAKNQQYDGPKDQMHIHMCVHCDMCEHAHTYTFVFVENLVWLLSMFFMTASAVDGYQFHRYGTFFKIFESFENVSLPLVKYLGPKFVTACNYN